MYGRIVWWKSMVWWMTVINRRVLEHSCELQLRPQSLLKNVLNWRRRRQHDTPSSTSMNSAMLSRTCLQHGYIDCNVTQWQLAPMHGIWRNGNACEGGTCV